MPRLLEPTDAGATGSQPPRAETALARPRREVLGIEFDAVNLEAAVDRVLTLAQTPGVDLVLTPNVDHVVRAGRDPGFMTVCRAGSLVVADGLPVVWASRLLGRPLPERVAGSDLMPRSAVAAARQGLRYYLLGGAPGDADRAAAVLATTAGADGCCGIDCPPLGFEQDPDYVAAMVARINAAAPNILYVGLGSPKQERLMMHLRDELATPVMMAVGVTFSFVAGTVKRAPRPFQRLGLEWFWRLACEPRRLWRRYADNLAVFPWLVARDWLRNRGERPLRDN